MKTANFIVDVIAREPKATVAICRDHGNDRLLRRAVCMALLAMTVIIPSASIFASGPGTTTGELLKIPVGARAVGMGEAYTAETQDSSALAWNPAGLSFASQKEAAFTHSSLIEGVHYEHMAFASPGDNYSVGASLGYLGYGSISGYSDSDNGNPVALGDQTAYSYVLSGGLSSFVMDRFSLGAAASVLRENLANVSAGTFAANLGADYEAAAHPAQGTYRFGASVLNLGPGLKFVSERDPLPRKIKFGAAAEHIKEWPLNLTADLTVPNDNSTYISIGSEYWFHELIALRLGYAGSNDEGKGLRLGLGLKLREFLFDYAYGSFGDFGATHRISFAFKWGERSKQLNRDQRAILKEAKKAGQNGDYVQAILAMDELLQKDPTNDRVLKQMIVAHQHMLQKELKAAVAQAETKEEVPSPEEFALHDLVPGQQAVVQNINSNAYDPKDPLGLSNLPDASSVDAAPAPAPSPAVVPAPSAAPAAESKPVMSAPAAPTASPAADGVLLNPNDIYGN